MITNGQKKSQIKNIFFHFYFLNKDISLNIYDKNLKLLTGVKHIHMEGTVSQILYSGRSFYFISKNG